MHQQYINLEVLPLLRPLFCLFWRGGYMYFCVHQSSCCYRCSKPPRWWGRIPPICVHPQCQNQLSKLGVGVLNLAIVQWSSFIFRGWNQWHEGWLYSLKTEMWVICSFNCRELCADLSMHIVCKSVCGKTLKLCIGTSHQYFITRHHKDHWQVCCTWNSTSYHENAVILASHCYRKHSWVPCAAVSKSEC